MNHLEQDKEDISRREALKVLAAAGSAIALSTLPKTWEKPIVINGALPAFAQTSPVNLGTPPTISNCSLTGPIGSCDSGGGVLGRIYLVTCDYADPDGNVLPNEARARVVFEYPSGASGIQEASLDPINLTGDGFSGTFTVPFCISFEKETGVTLTLSCLDANRLESNTETVEITAPTTTKIGEADGQPGVIIAK